MTSIRQNILATLAYYDVLDLPLTAREVFARLINFKHLPNWKLETGNWKLEDVLRELGQLVFDRIVSRMGEYYFLFNKRYLVPLRLKHEKIAKNKWRKARHAIRWLSLLPYIEAVFASGSLAISNTDELSDLDVLIVIQSGRMWLARLLITSLLSVLHVRRRGSDRIAPDKICPNHYISDGSLSIPYKSVYNAQTYCNLVPIYARREEIIEKFKNANSWVLDFVFNWNLNDKPILKTGWLEIIAKLVESSLSTKLGDFLEKRAKRFQYRRIDLNPATRQSGGRVVFNDEQLEFHPRSIETIIIKKYNTNLTRLGMTEFAIEKDSGLNK